jgi:peptide-methionine (S)-S-oxide reductase
MAKKPGSLHELIVIAFTALLPSKVALGGSIMKMDVKTGIETATFAGGCFWCMEKPFDEIPGVIATTSGYTGGHKKNPTYEEVSAGTTGHAESIEVTYDPKIVSYEKLLDVFWKNVDPTAKDRQFCDSGSQYRSAIFTHGPDQAKAAQTSKAELEKSGRFPVIHTEITAASEFFLAEEYHQDYYKKNPIRYRYYRHGCGRDKRLEELWGSVPHG